MKCFITTFLLTLSNIVSAQIYELNYNVKFGFVKCADVTVKVFDNQNYTQISAAAKSCGLADFLLRFMKNTTVLLINLTIIYPIG